MLEKLYLDVFEKYVAMNDFRSYDNTHIIKYILPNNIYPLLHYKSKRETSVFR